MAQLDAGSLGGRAGVALKRSFHAGFTTDLLRCAQVVISKREIGEMARGVIKWSEPLRFLNTSHVSAMSLMR
jgi:hypothetical protein